MGILTWVVVLPASVLSRSDVSPPLITLSRDVEVQTLSDRLIQNWGFSGYMLEKEDGEGQKR